MNYLREVKAKQFLTSFDGFQFYVHEFYHDIIMAGMPFKE